MPFDWKDGRPADIAVWLEEVIRQVPDAIEEVAIDEASRGESEMKERAPWKDRSGNARNGLFGRAEREGDDTVIYLGGTMEYQPWLELGTERMRPYPIIFPVAKEVSVSYQEGAIVVIEGLLS